jgi:hypothetical protein
MVQQSPIAAGVIGKVNAQQPPFLSAALWMFTASILAFGDLLLALRAADHLIAAII